MAGTQAGKAHDNDLAKRQGWRTASAELSDDLRNRISEAPAGVLNHP